MSEMLENRVEERDYFVKSLQLPITVVWKDIKAKRIHGYITPCPKVLLVKHGESILACNAPLLDDTRKTHLLQK